MNKLTKWIAGLSTFLVFLYFGYNIFCKFYLCSLLPQAFYPILAYLPKIFTVLVVFVIFYVGKLIIEYFLNLHRQYDKAYRLFGFIWWLLFVIIALTLLVGNLKSLVTSLGLIGFGITLALQKPILNFVGWLTIITKNIYEEGDRIQVGEIRGDVIEIQMMNTVLDGLIPNSETKNNKIVTFPNEFVLTQEVDNYNKGTNYITDQLIIGITYESNYTKGIKLFEDILTKNIIKNKQYYKKEEKGKIKLITEIRDRLKNKKDTKSIQEFQELEDELQPQVRLELADSSINLIGQYLVPYNAIKQNRTAINLEFLNIIKKHKDIEIAYPHLEIVKK